MLRQQYKIFFLVTLIAYCIIPFVTFAEDDGSEGETYYSTWELEHAGKTVLIWYYKTKRDFGNNQPNKAWVQNKEFIIHPHVRPPTINGIYLLEHSKVNEGEDVLDVGTGSGVLAIVAAKMGIRAVHAIDTDPCAVYEACQNVRLNQLEAFVTILDGGLGTIGEGYDLVFANLRTPTLFSLRDSLEKKIDSGAVLVFSGIKTEECGSISDYYAQTGYSVLKKRSEMGWSAISFSKGPILKRKD